MSEYYNSTFKRNLPFAKKKRLPKNHNITINNCMHFDKSDNAIDF